MPEHARFAIRDLADLGGVSRRTVRYYVQEGLLPPPLDLAWYGCRNDGSKPTEWLKIGYACPGGVLRRVLWPDSSRGSV